MDPARLRERLREIVSPRTGDVDSGTGRVSFEAEPVVASPPAVPRDLERALGGRWRRDCFLVERRVDPCTIHGRWLVGELAGLVLGGQREASLLAGGAAMRAPLVFLDIETTGLSGGAGTHAFLVGCGWFEADGAFTIRQYVLARFAHERALLGEVATELGRAGALVTFNGKSFDAPVLETRYLFHRLAWVGVRLPHLDVLHAARRFWGGDHAACSLGVLERSVLGSLRAGDLPGIEIPGRYFRFVRTGDPGLLSDVLEHNRLDLMALAGVTARLVALVVGGPAAVSSAREALALGHVYARSGCEPEALDAYERAVAMNGNGTVAIDALRAMALAHRRGRRYEDAAGCWSRLLETPECPRHVIREASRALAVHHEHRVRDFQRARMFALRSLEGEAPEPWHRAVRHRLARLDRRSNSAVLSSEC
jgi:hypothetical protein